MRAGLADFDIYMPASRAKDPGRRRKAGIPAGLAFATKPELAIDQVRRIAASGIGVLWAAADEVYGRCSEFRGALRALGLAYVVIVPCSQAIVLAKDKVLPAEQAFSGAVFEHRSAGNGAKGPRYADWALAATADPREFLLVRRLPGRGKNQYTFYLCYAPAGRPATITYFIAIAGRRWPVESTFRTGKDAFGWDQCQARTFAAQCRTPLSTALAQLRAIAAGAARPAPSPSPRPPNPRSQPGRPRKVSLSWASTPATRRCPSPPDSPARPASRP